MRPIRFPALLAAGLLSLADISTAAELLLQPGQIEPLGIQVATIKTPVDGGRRTLPARVAVPNDQLRVVSAPVAGLIESLAVAPGTPVRRGQVVARLASPQALELQRKSLEAASQAQLAQQELNRSEQLFAEGLIAESRLQTTRANAAQAGAAAAQGRQTLAMAGIGSERVGGALALTSPIDGIVLEQGAQVGQQVEAATLIYRIARLTPLWLEIQAPVTLGAELKAGLAVRVPGTSAKGQLLAIGRAVDADSQSVTLRAAITNGAESLRPGQAVEAELDLPAGSALRLPATALARQEDKAVVFIRTRQDSKGIIFEPRPVKVLGQAGGEILVEGVRAGEVVATRGVSSLKALWTGIGKE